MLFLLVVMAAPYVYVNSTTFSRDALRGSVLLPEIPERGVEIGGEWEFFPGLVSPEEAGHAAAEYMRVPSVWNHRVGSFGCATYRLTVHFPVSERRLSLKINWVYSSYRLYVNGRNVATVGTPASKKEGYVPQIRPIIVPLDPGTQTAVLVFQVANYFNFEGGITNRIEAGYSDTVSARRERNFVTSWFFAGSIFIMALFHLIIFFWGNRDRSYLQFGLFCLVSILYSLILGEASFGSIFPVPYQFIFRILYVSIVLGPLLLAIYFRSLFPWKRLDFFVYALCAAVAVFSLLCFLLDGAALVVLYRFMHPITFLCLIYPFIIIIRGVIRSADDAIPMLIAYGIAIIFVVNDILNAYQIVNTGSWGAFGVICFLCVKTVYLGMNFASAYNRLENQSIELERKVNERTSLLVEYNERLRTAKAEIEEADGFKKTFITSLSHEIRTPLNGIIGMIDVLSFNASGSDQKRHIMTLKKASSDLLRIVNGTLDISRIQSGKLEVDVEEVRLSDMLSKVEKITEYYAHEKGKDSLTLLFYLSPEVPAVVFSDGVKLYQIMTNLLSNAVKFTETGTVSAEILVRGFRDSRVVLRFIVRDTGRGIPDERRGEVFQTFSRVHRGASAPEGSGLGLSICKHLVELLGGRIEFESSEGSGSSFFFDIEFDYSGSGEDIRLARSVILFALPKNVQDYLVRVLGEWHASILIVEEKDTLDDYIREKLVVPADSELISGDASLPASTAALFLRAVCLSSSPMMQSGGIDDSSVISGALSQRKLMQHFGIEGAAESTQTAIGGKIERRLLAIEDDPTNREVLKEFALESGVDIVFAHNGEDGVAAAGRGGFDMIFMDIELPDMTGYEAAAAIRANEQAAGRARTTIIAVSAHSAERFIKKGRESGIDGFMRKPFTYAEYVSVVSGSGAANFTHGDTDKKRYWRRIFSVFTENTPELLAQMNDAAAAGNCELVAKLAHRLKGSLSYFGDTGLVSHIEEIEEKVCTWEKKYTGVVVQDLAIRIDEFEKRFRDEKGLWEE
jgi:signal transduction histidine kinase/FixJ family two-component response regulator